MNLRIITDTERLEYLVNDGLLPMLHNEKWTLTHTTSFEHSIDEEILYLTKEHKLISSKSRSLWDFVLFFDSYREALDYGIKNHLNKYELWIHWS